MLGMVEGVVLQTTEAKEFFPKWIQKKAIVLQNSLNPEFVRPVYMGEKRKDIVSVGRIDNNKNQKMLVEAFALLEKDFPEWKVILYGDGEARKSLEERVKELGLEERVLFKGVQSNIPEKIEGASIFVLSSKQEGMPNALIEAMVLGLAVVSTDCPCGGPRDLIDPGKNGLLVPVDDTIALSNAIRHLMENEELRNCISCNAIQLKEKVLPDNVNMLWENYLKEVSKR